MTDGAKAGLTHSLSTHASHAERVERRSERVLRPAPSRSRTEQIVDLLCDDSVGGAATGQVESPGAARARPVFPSRKVIEVLIEDLKSVLFPWHFGPPELTYASRRPFVMARVQHITQALGQQVLRCLAFDCKHTAHERHSSCTACAQRALEVTDHVLRRLPHIRQLLHADAQAAFGRDPAVRFADEPLFCYPGLVAIAQHRIAHELHLLGVPLLPRLISELAHAQTGIDIHPSARIGSSFFIDHGTGVVIGETCQIGERVRIFQGVTLGARGTESGQAELTRGLPRHPIVEDDVVIYAGATVLGRITIGKGAMIGGNVWLTRDVAPGAQVTQVQARHNLFKDGAGI